MTIVGSPAYTPPGFDAAEIIASIRAWIEIESPTDNAAGIAAMSDRIERDYRSIGAAVERIPGRDGFGDHLLVTDARHCPGAAADGLGILVLSHYDTVHPVGVLDGPLPCRIEGDRLYGPGAEDMKGGTYLALAALRQIAREGRSTKLPVRHLIVSDEEMGSMTSRGHIEREAHRARFVLVTEPARSGGKIVTARKGIANYTVSAHGLAAHAGVEHHLGRNAIREIAHQVLALEAMTDYQRGVTVNVGAIRGGGRSNVVPDFAAVDVDVRLPDFASGAELDARIKALTPKDPDVRVEISGGVNRPGYEKSPGIAALYEHARALAGEIGFELIDLKTGGGSDGNFTAPIAPTLDGLGVDGDGGHTLDERLYISSIIPRATLLLRLFETLE